MTHSKKKKQSKKMRKRRRQRRLILLGLFLVFAILMLAVVGFCMRRYVSKYPENVAADNVFVGSIDVSGMNRKEVQSVLETNLETAKGANVTFAVDGEEETTTLEKLGLSYKDIKALSKSAVSYGKDESLWHNYWNLKRLKKESAVLEENFITNKEKTVDYLERTVIPLADVAQNATISKTSDGFEITEESEGITVDIDKTRKALKSALNGNWDYNDISVEVPLKKDKPTIKASDLESIEDELGTFSTDAGGGSRLQNLKTGISKLNGLIIMPGEEVSVHDVTAPYDEENGYVEAGSYENGQVVETFGGGICQVSSTLYNALLYAELEIVERYPHSMMVNYVEASRDAAIAGDVKDLVFKNSYDTPIYIKGEIDGSNQLTVTIYGKDTRKEGRRIEFESEIISTTEYKTVYKADSETALGQMYNGGSPHTGKEAKLWKIVYEDDKEVSREEVNYSMYKKSDYIIKVGTKSDTYAASALVQQAIGTQDINKIYAAINEASKL